MMRTRGVVAALATMLLVAACSTEGPVTEPNVRARADATGETVYQTNAVAGCVDDKPNEWHWVITNSNPATTAGVPQSITVYFATAGQVTVPLEKVTGKTAHYTIVDQYLDDELVAPYASFVRPDGFTFDHFNSSHTPCGDGDLEQKALLAIEKTANASFDREWTWDISKSVDPTTVTLNAGQTKSVGYTVSLKGSSQDKNFTVSGTIKVSNAGNADAFIQDVTDILTDDVNCGVTFPYTLTPGSTLDCTYSATLASKTDGENTATVTATVALGNSVNSPASTEPVPYSFGSTPTNETNKCVKLSDTYGGNTLPAQVCGADDGSAYSNTWTYNRTIGPYALSQCGTTPKVDNTATVSTTDDTKIDDSSARVTVTLICGCTPGYWANNIPGDKNGNVGSWQWTDPATLPGTKLSDRGFTFAVATTYANKTFLEALKLQGGSTLNGGREILLRAASAAWLNAAVLPAMGYPLTKAQVIGAVNPVLNGTDRAAMITLASTLDGYNNGGCSRDAKGRLIQ